MRSVGIDSMILVYADIVPSRSAGTSAELRELVVRSKLLIHQLAREKAIIILPTVAISEVLVPVPAIQMGALIATLADLFVCAPFDLHAAAIAANLWAQHNQLPRDQQYQNRRALKADTLIVASAKAAGATDFYSHDRNCRAIAGLVMKPHDLPTSDSEDMFLEHDIRRGDA